MEKMNVQNLSDSERKLMAFAMAHIGSNGDAHLPATSDQAGFMSADDKHQLDAKGDYARGLATADNLDILTLDFGKFVARNFINAPAEVDDSVCLVEIVGNSIWKRIRFDWISAGKTYNRYIYPTMDTGWQYSEWVDIVPMNGFTGTIKGRKLYGDYWTQVEIRLDLKCNLTTNATVQIATIPTEMTFSGDPAIYGNLVAQSGGINTIADFILHQGNMLEVFRDGATALPISRVFGTITFSR